MMSHFHTCAAPAAALLIGLMAALPAHGYDFLSDAPAGRFAMNLELSGGYGYLSWKGMADSALTAWNNAGVGPQQDHHFFSVRSPTVSGDACAQDGVNEVMFSSTMCGLEFGSILALTQGYLDDDGRRVEADVIFDANRSWDAYSGALINNRPDFSRVALHEFGHIVGLDHPDEVGQTKTALMNSVISNLNALQDDDIQGARLVNWYWFGFPTQYGVAPGSTVASNTITVSGLAVASPVSVSNGEYSIDGGAYTRATGTVGNGQTVSVRVAAAAQPMTATTATLSIGAAQGEFTAITAQGAAPIVVNTTGYTPLTDGQSKTYLKSGADGVENETLTVQPGTTTVNGLAAKAILYSDGSIAYVTNDANGTREHRQFEPAVYFKGAGLADATTTMSPPLLDTPVLATLGQPIVSTGIANISVPQLWLDVDLDYTSSLTLEGFETVTVPAGTFNTLRVSASLNMKGFIGYAPYDRTVTSLFWMAHGVDTVKAVTTASYITSKVLTASNLLPVANIAAGWNLFGNGTDAPVNVASVLGDTTQVSTVWKWLPGANQWAMYAPSLTAQAMSDYAAAKGYSVLATINPGEGYWINAKGPFTARLPSGNAVTASTLRPGLATGWNLLAVGETQTPAQFNVALGSAPASPPPANLVSLWSWEPVGAAWYFYAPSLEADGSLASYIASRGYRDFATGGKTLGPNVGFWVNKP